MRKLVIMQWSCLIVLLASWIAPSAVLAQARAGTVENTSSPAATQACSLATMEANLQKPSEIAPDPQTMLVESPDPSQTFVSAERRIPCTTADLLLQGFELKSAYRSGPEASTNGAFEGVAYLQRGHLLVICYDEMRLSERTDNAQVLGTRSACQQVVQPRLRSTGQSAATPRK